MHSQTYANLVQALFMRNFDRKIEPSMKQVIFYTDKLAKKLEIKGLPSHQTKYNVINRLVEDGYLVAKQLNGKKAINLSKKVVSYMNKEYVFVPRDRYEERERARQDTKKSWQ